MKDLDELDDFALRHKRVSWQGLVRVLVRILRTIDKRITALEEERFDEQNAWNSWEAYRSNDLERVREKLEGRLDALDEQKADRNDTARDFSVLSNLLRIYSGQEGKPAPLSCCEGCAYFPCADYDHGELEARLEHIGTGHASCYREKPLPAPDPDVVCKGCAKDFTCDQSRSKLCNLGGNGHPCCYREKHTCGECRHRRLITGVGECWRRHEGRFCIYPSPSAEACPNFVAVK